MNLRRARVRLDWMDEDGYVTGWADDVGWNGFAAAWLDVTAIYDLNEGAKANPDVGSIYTPEAEGVSRLRVEVDATTYPFLFTFFDVDPDGSERELPRQEINGVDHFDFSGWMFTEITDKERHVRLP